MGWWPFGKNNAAGDLPREVQQIFDKARRFLDDETAQNNALPEQFHRALSQNPPVDQIKNSFGEFGRTLTNPIPVNGPVGQLVYLSRLETLNGVPIAFHRLGAHDNVDVFEVVSEDGRHWDILYLSLYFLRKSQAVPSGYRSMTDQGRRALLRGTTQYVDSFPRGIWHATLECTKRMIGLPIGDTNLKIFDTENDVARPQKHLEALRQHKFTSQSIFGAAAEQRRDPITEMFDQTAVLLSDRLEEAAHEMDLRLGQKFERELTYVLLYVFTTLLFSVSREDPIAAADQLTQYHLKRLASTDGTSLSELVHEYRRRFAGYKGIELFGTGDRVLVNEGALVLGRQLADQPNMVFGTIVTSTIAAVLKPLRDGLSSV